MTSPCFPAAPPGKAIHTVSKMSEPRRGRGTAGAGGHHRNIINKMPLITLTTNVSLAPDKQGALAKALSEALAKALDKPEAYVAVRVTAGACVLFGGDAGPAAIASVRSIGKIDVGSNTVVSGAVAGVLEEYGGVPSDRVYITFTDVARENWGWKGKTFANQ